MNNFYEKELYKTENNFGTDGIEIIRAYPTFKRGAILASSLRDEEASPAQTRAKGQALWTPTHNRIPSIPLVDPSHPQGSAPKQQLDSRAGDGPAQSHQGQRAAVELFHPETNTVSLQESGISPTGHPCGNP